MLEKDLIKLLKQRDHNAFASLYERYWRQVYNFCCLYIKNYSVVEEVVQEVFVKIWESCESIKEEENFKGLLFIITRNHIFNKHRKYVNEVFYKITILSAIEDSYNMDEEIEIRDLREYIDRLIEEFPSRRREIFKLSRKEHKSYKEIARLLQISEKTVENQIGEALKYLRKNLY